LSAPGCQQEPKNLSCAPNLGPAYSLDVGRGGLLTRLWSRVRRVHHSGRSRKFSRKRQNRPVTRDHSATAAAAILIEDHRKNFVRILVSLLRILRLMRLPADMLRALLRLGMSKCHTEMSCPSVLLTPLLEGMSLIGQFS
jgi:hypothetical protein